MGTCVSQLLNVLAFRENLSIGKWAWYIRSFFINFVLFLVLFFLTTPFIIVSGLDRYLKNQPLANTLSLSSSCLARAALFSP